MIVAPGGVARNFSSPFAPPVRECFVADSVLLRDVASSLCKLRIALRACKRRISATSLIPFACSAPITPRLFEWNVRLSKFSSPFDYSPGCFEKRESVCLFQNTQMVHLRGNRPVCHYPISSLAGWMAGFRLLPLPVAFLLGDRP